MNAIDFNVIAEQADLPAILARAGIEVRNGKAFCPFHDNTNTPAMTVFQVGGRWRFDCKSCGAKGDAIGFLAQWERIAPIEAARQLAGVRPEDARRKAPGVRQDGPHGSPRQDWTSARRQPYGEANGRLPEVPAAWAEPEWQEVVDAIIREAEDVLWSPAGREALDWLRGRGLLDLTIRRFRLGFLPKRVRTDPIEALRNRDGPRGITAPRGITLPWCHPEAWYHANEPTPGPRWVGCNVRRLTPEVYGPLPVDQEKCFAFAGSQRGFAYPFSDLVLGLPALIVEGEWDALIAWQELGWVANVISVGGAKQDPKPSAAAELDGCPTWLIALHNDDAGNEGAKKWAIRSRGKSVRALLPPGRDLNDLHLGGSLMGWLRSEYEALGWPWPLRA